MNDADRALPARLKLYVNERFPLQAFLPLIILLTLALDFAGQALADAPIVVDRGTLAGVGLMALIFFHLRLFDEFKDYETDRVVHPDRIVSRGVVTLAELRLVTVGVVALEGVLAVALGPALVLRYLLVLGFSLAMFKEFLIGPLLRRDMVIYAASHQLIIPLLGWLGLGLHTQGGPAVYGGGLPWLMVALLASAFAFELSRKVHDPAGPPTQEETYSRYFGWRRLTWVVAALLAVATLALLALAHALSLPSWFTAVIVVLAGVLGVLIIRTGPAPGSKQVAAFNLLMAVYLLGWYLALIIAVAATRPVAFASG